MDAWMEGGWRHADLGKPHLSGRLVNMGFLLLMPVAGSPSYFPGSKSQGSMCAYSVDSVCDARVRLKGLKGCEGATTWRPERGITI